MSLVARIAHDSMPHANVMAWVRSIGMFVVNGNSKFGLKGMSLQWVPSISSSHMDEEGYITNVAYCGH